MEALKASVEATGAKKPAAKRAASSWDAAQEGRRRLAGSREAEAER